MNFRLTFHLNQLARVHTIVYSGFITDVELLLLRIKGMKIFDCYCDSPCIFLHYVVTVDGTLGHEVVATTVLCHLTKKSLGSTGKQLYKY